MSTLYSEIKEYVLTLPEGSSFDVYELNELFYMPRTNLVSMWLKLWYEEGILNKINRGKYIIPKASYSPRWQILVTEAKTRKIYTYLGGTSFKSLPEARREAKLLRANEKKEYAYFRKAKKFKVFRCY